VLPSGELADDDVGITAARARTPTFSIYCNVNVNLGGHAPRIADPGRRASTVV
jgi:hypothetical protein